MSRHQHTNDRYQLAYGIDHTVGPFVQVFALPPDPNDVPLVDIDSFGLDFHNGNQALHQAVTAIRSLPLTCQDVQRITQACGFSSDVLQNIEQSWNAEEVCASKKQKQ